jgi:hypothetical protein
MALYSYEYGLPMHGLMACDRSASLPGAGRGRGDAASVSKHVVRPT